MRLDVRHVVLTIKNPHLGLDKLNSILRVALEYDFCNVAVALNEENTQFALCFTRTRTSLFVEEWVKFWLRPFRVEYQLDFDDPENGPMLVTSRTKIV